MNNLVKIGGGIVAAGALLVGSLAAYVAVQPGELAVERSIEVAASPADVAPYANDLKLWNEWSPWSDIDPDMKAAYSDPTAGKGAWYTWEGNDEVGKGKMTVTMDEPGHVEHALEFMAPMEGQATAVLTWTGTPEKTTVVWAFRQEAGFMAKAANLAMDIESMLAADYDKGLQRMKPIVEKAATDRIAREKAEAEAKALAEAAQAGDADPVEAATP